MDELAYSDYDYEDDEVEYADYYEDDNYVFPDEPWQESQKEEEDEEVPPFTLEELYQFCVIPTISDSYKHLLGILSWSLLFLISSRIIRLPSVVIHASSAAFGSALLWQMFEWRCNVIGGLLLITYLNLLSSHYALRRWRGPSCFIVGVIYLIICEVWLVTPLWMHAIRGIQMVILMKLVSIGYDLDGAQLKTLPNLLQILGYTFSPGTVIFGPWISYSTYAAILNPMEWKLKWLFKILVKVFASGIFLLCSTCFINWLISDLSNRWLLAYRDALSFRTSHYFVSYLSEASSLLSGLDVVNVCDPLSIEFPRSLVEVVIHWNTAMHRWLKTYVFKPSHFRFGPFIAIFLTYGVSALFHGLNFQLCSVLLSLGFYTYTEHSLRKKLATLFDACIGARRCSQCTHKRKASSAFCICANAFFGLLTVFHLGYLGMMFDSSGQAQENGYSMFHTLKKWSALGYLSHWIALFMYILMSVL